MVDGLLYSNRGEELIVSVSQFVTRVTSTDFHDAK